MAFGSSAQTKAPTTAQTDRPTENVFFDTKTGIRIFQLPFGSEEIKIKRHWLALEGDTWTPKFGYSPSDKRRAIPITVAVWDSESGKWVGDGAYWRKNPIDQYVAALEESDRQGKYAQERFFLNVLDLTPVKIDSEGNVFWPDGRMQYTGISADAPRMPVGKIRILEGSSSDPEGKSMYANLFRTMSGALSEDGEVLNPTEFQIKLITSGAGKSTVRDCQMHTVKPIDAQYASLPLYDLKSWLKPWPNTAIEELMSGADYGETVKKYSIKLYPDLAGEKDNLFP